MDVNLVDYLTGLPNITYFLSLADAKKKSMFKNKKNPCLIYIDLYGMRKFNNTFGFEEGNKLLISLGKLLVNVFGLENCCRIGGDDFVVLTEDDVIEAVLNHLFEEVRKMEKQGEQSVEFFLHVGIYLFKTEDIEINIACDRAKTACLLIQGKNDSAFSYYDISIAEANEKKQYIIDNLDKALSEHWIKVYYQPIIRAINGRVCDEEALARWMDPVNGFLSPAVFIPLLEESKPIYKVDLYILDQVLEKMKFMAEQGYHMVSQSINLSRADFEVCDIVEEICKRIDKSGISRDKINIEITESIIGDDFEFMKAQIERFKKLGFMVWMDDFGSGYSSLDVLQQISFDLIKFDMSFMRQLDKGENGKIILTELMRMASSLGVDTVCEGVETEEQVKFLQEIGCSKLQGFYYQKPIPVEQILEKYKKGKQIGFENPDEAEYCNTVGRVNLHDLSVIANNENGFNSFFNSLPMAIIEIGKDSVRFTRTNKSYREFIKRYFGLKIQSDEVPLRQVMKGDGSGFMLMAKQAAKEGKKLFVDEKLPEGSEAYYFVSKLAENPVTKKTAVVAVVLSVKDGKKGETYADIARALASDYFNIFYVNLETEDYIEYGTNAGEFEFATERHGKNFFSEARKAAMENLYKDDRKTFVQALTKENVIKQINENGTFTLIYRLLKFGIPYYVNMKAVRLLRDKKYIIIGISNIDSQVKQKKIVEQAKQNQLSYTRLMALFGDYICVYVINLKDNSYILYQATEEFEEIGVQTEGEDFFKDTQINAEKAVVPEDRELFKLRHTKEVILDSIRKEGVFTSHHRLMISGKSVMVAVR
nr:bifunctional diguanylate cyclase/phosphodiesterase [Treponema sp.]